MLKMLFRYSLAISLLEPPQLSHVPSLESLSTDRQIPLSHISRKTRPSFQEKTIVAGHLSGTQQSSQVSLSVTFLSYLKLRFADAAREPVPFDFRGLCWVDRAEEGMRAME